MSEFTRADEMARIGEATTDASVAKLRQMLSRLDVKLFGTGASQRNRIKVLQRSLDTG